MKASFIGHVFLVAIIASAAFDACSPNGVVSGRFVLDRSSRLPIWFKLPQTVPRDDIAVQITVYEPTTSDQGKVSVSVMYSNQVLDRAVGVWRWHPESVRSGRPANPPNWIMCEIRGTVEIYEQAERNDVLRIVDRPSKKK